MVSFGYDHRMGVFEHPEFDDHEIVHFVRDRAANLSAIIAVHDPGPMGMAGGGCRMWPYPDSAAALRDALRLSKAMSYKMALAELPAGGAKSVIIGDPETDKSAAMLQAMAEAVQRLGGRYVIGQDVGTTTADLEAMKAHTHFVHVGRGSSTAATAYGVFVGMKACLRRRLGTDDLRDVRVAVQGLGGVGAGLCRYLHQAGATLYVSDLRQEAVEDAARQWQATAVRPDRILAQEVDVVAPCALGDALTAESIAALKCRIVAGGANNQLFDSGCAELLEARGVLYAPDFVINSGGVIGAAQGVCEDATEETVTLSAAKVGPMLESVFDRAERAGISTHAAAVALAKEQRG